MVAGKDKVQPVITQRRKSLKSAGAVEKALAAGAPSKAMKLVVNGVTHELREGVEVKPNHTLLHTLRETLNLTGTKKSCDYGWCGRCVVLIDGKPALACLLLTMDCVGKDIITIEGLSSGGKLHPVQQAFIDYSALQCGMCTPSQILLIKALLDKNPKPTEEEIREAISPTVCRCGGTYRLVVEAVLALTREAKNG